MLELLNVLATERMKLKRNKLLLVCNAIAILLPVLLICQDVYDLGDAIPKWTAINWVFRVQTLCQLIAYPILSGFIIIFLLQKEYGDMTIINTLTAPVGRIKFLLGKLIVWATWHVIITICFLAISCVGIYVLYDKSILLENLSAITTTILKTGILNLGTLLPVAWIAVLQKKTFYPSLLFTMIITGLGLAGLYWPVLLGSIIPWSAVDLLSVPGGEVISGVAYTSVALCAVVGFGLTAYSFKKQEL